MESETADKGGAAFQALEPRGQEGRSGGEKKNLAGKRQPEHPDLGLCCSVPVLAPPT